MHCLDKNRSVAPIFHCCFFFFNNTSCWNYWDHTMVAVKLNEFMTHHWEHRVFDLMLHSLLTLYSSEYEWSFSCSAVQRRVIRTSSHQSSVTCNAISQSVNKVSLMSNLCSSFCFSLGLLLLLLLLSPVHYSDCKCFISGIKCRRHRILDWGE